MPQRMPGQADGQRLLAGDHVELPIQDADERILAGSRCASHVGIMPTRSDKQSVGKPTRKVRKSHKVAETRACDLSAREPATMWH